MTQPSGSQNTNQVVVTGSSPVPIVPPNSTRKKVNVRVVTASSTVFIGGPHVSASNGWPIKDTDTVPYESTSTDGIWGFVSGGSITVAFAEVSQD